MPKSSRPKKKPSIETSNDKSIGRNPIERNNNKFLFYLLSILLLAYLREERKEDILRLL